MNTMTAPTTPDIDANPISARPWPMPSTPTAAAQQLSAITRSEMAWTAAGILDQAVLTLMQLPRLRTDPTFPRSFLLEMMQAYHRFQLKDRVPFSQLKLFAASGRCLVGLVREWRWLLKNNSALTSSEKKRRAYKIASLAAASILIPYLILQRR